VSALAALVAAAFWTAFVWTIWWGWRENQRELAARRYHRTVEALRRASTYEGDE